MNHDQNFKNMLELEPDPERQFKYLDFIDVYAHQDDNERVIEQQRFTAEAATVSGFAEWFIRQGEAPVLLHLPTLKIGSPSESVRQHVQSADPEPSSVDWPGCPLQGTRFVPAVLELRKRSSGDAACA